MASIHRFIKTLNQRATLALWESRLSAIAVGTEQFNAFMAHKHTYCPLITESASTALLSWIRQSLPEIGCDKMIRRFESK